jgi:hypothetical protein
MEVTLRARPLAPAESWFAGGDLRAQRGATNLEGTGLELKARITNRTEHAIRVTFGGNDRLRGQNETIQTGSSHLPRKSHLNGLA